ncbi:MAG: hypothetical protein JW761_01970 [Prolixibacteraceae bacterium]|nr:hypothetical protein [Prolixibacteraceae bacterium]
MITSPFLLPAMYKAIIFISIGLMRVCLISVVLTGLIFFSCKENTKMDFDYNSIPSTYHMKGEVIIDSMMSPQSVDFYKSSIFSIESGGKYKLKVYDNETGHEVYSAIEGGRGVNEMLQPWTLCVRGDTCWIFDLILKKMIGICNPNNPNCTICKEFVFKDRNSEMVIPKTNSTFIGIGFSDSLKQFTEYNGSGQIIRTFGSFPDIVPKNFVEGAEDALFYGTVYKSKIGLSYEQKRIAVAYTRFNMIDIFDFEGRLLKRIRGPEEINVKVERVSPRPGMVMYDASPKYLAYRQIKTGQEEIWVSHSGVVLTRDNYLQTVPHKIYCFSWDGELIRELQFDIPVNDFAIDWENKKLYCLSEHLYPCVYFFSLKGII